MKSDLLRLARMNVYIVVMKGLLPIALLSLLLMLPSIGSGGDTYVYLCNSSSSYAYHLDRNCRGLARCKHDVIEVTQAEAIASYGRKLCGWED